MQTRISRETVVEELDGLLAIGFDVNDALLALGRGYEAVRKSVLRAQRQDLADTLEAWKRADGERLQRARGERWT